MNQMSGAELIAAERQRQLGAEGWTPEHDNGHGDGDLIVAAACYIEHVEGFDSGRVLATWPWHPSWWKPSDDPIRDLVKAGALIAAEIDRRQRAATPENVESPNESA